MNAYERHAAARRLDNERRLMGETLAAFHAREHAKPPTLAEVFARCPWTPDMLEQAHG